MHIHVFQATKDQHAMVVEVTHKTLSWLRGQGWVSKSFATAALAFKECRKLNDSVDNVRDTPEWQAERRNDALRARRAARDLRRQEKAAREHRRAGPLGVCTKPDCGCQKAVTV